MSYLCAMKRELCFLKSSNYSSPFREKQGPDREIDLLDENPFEYIEDVSGVYIIASSDNTRFIYPKGSNGVIYIGKSDHLVQRLKTHLANLRMVKACDEELLCNHQQVNQRYQYMNSFGAKVYIYYCRKTQDAKWLESYILHRFYEKYRALPVGNGARSFSE